MNTTHNLLRRLQRRVPAGITPQFATGQALLDWQREEGLRRGQELDVQNRQARVKNHFGRSGIRDLYRRCTFESYKVTCDGQKNALTEAKSWASRFEIGFASFVFSGKPGTGKNHLTAAMGNQLIKQGKTVMIITVADLLLRVRACYEKGSSEATLLNELCQVDLLVLDEVGVQRETTNEFVVLNQIIDRRLSDMKPVGILTNLKVQELSQLLGERVIDRLRMDGGIWVNFNWESHRDKVKSQ